MILRAWQTQIDEARAAEYDAFARDRSLPMFERHAGLLGVLFIAPAPGERVVLTVWRDAAAVRALETSADYQRTVQAIEAEGFLLPPQRVDAFEVPDPRPPALK